MALNLRSLTPPLAVALGPLDLISLSDNGRSTLVVRQSEGSGLPPSARAGGGGSRDGARTTLLPSPRLPPPLPALPPSNGWLR